MFTEGSVRQLHNVIGALFYTICLQKEVCANYIVSLAHFFTIYFLIFFTERQVRQLHIVIGALFYPLTLPMQSLNPPS